jgi:hypothetical protein
LECGETKQPNNQTKKEIHYISLPVFFYLLISALNSSAVMVFENMPKVPSVAAFWPSSLVAAQQSVRVMTWFVHKKCRRSSRF